MLKIKFTILLEQLYCIYYNIGPKSAPKGVTIVSFHPITWSYVQVEERLKTQMAYQTPHITTFRVTKSIVQIEEMLKAQTTYQTPHVVAIRAIESSIQVEERL
jgi:uncharacterized protein involved in tolerance to divalent cations